MRELYKRIEQAETLNIEVDIEVDSVKKDYPWLFSVFIKFDANNQKSESYEEFLEIKESLIIALEYDKNVKYVGSRVVDGWSELYFYSNDSKELNSMASAILQESKYLYESNVVKDTKWGFYNKQLFPTEEEFCHIQSAKIIFLLQEENDNIEVSRDVEHYISFETPTQKNRFINTLDIDGFTFKDEISSEEFEHGVALVKNHSILEDEVHKVVSKLFKEIKKENGYYEGWSTTLVEKEQ